MHTFVSKYASSRRTEERYCYVKLYYYVKRSTETNIHICNLRGNIAELAIFCLGYQRRRRCALHPQHKSHHKVMSIKLLNNTFSISNLSGKINVLLQSVRLMPLYHNVSLCRDFKTCYLSSAVREGDLALARAAACFRAA